jgi:hypothetical protein
MLRVAATGGAPMGPLSGTAQTGATTRIELANPMLSGRCFDRSSQRIRPVDLAAMPSPMDAAPKEDNL